jgi:hypothetical protein
VVPSLAAVCGPVLLLIGALTTEQSVYLTGWAICVLVIVFGLWNKQRPSLTQITSCLLLLFLAVRLIVPLKYGQLVGEDTRDVVALAQFLDSAGSLSSVSQALIPPLPLYSAFPGLYALILTVHNVTSIPILDICTYGGPIVSILFILPVLLLVSRLSGSDARSWLATGIIIGVSPLLMYWQMMLVHQTLALALLGVIFLVDNIQQGDRPSVPFGILLLLLLLALAAVHHMTMFMLAASYLVAIPLRFFFPKRSNLALSLLPILITVAYWMYNGGGRMFSHFAITGGKIVAGLLDPAGISTTSYYQGGVFPGHSAILITAIAASVIALVSAAAAGVFGFMRTRAGRSSQSLLLLAVLVVATAGTVIGVSTSISAQAERTALFGTLIASIFAGVAIARLLGGTRWVRALGIAIVIIIVIPAPFKLFRFMSDPPPSYIYRAEDVDQMDIDTYGRLVYKGASFFAASEFVRQHAGPTTPVFGDASSAAQLAALSNEAFLPRIALYPDDYRTHTDTQSVVLIDHRFVAFLKTRESGLYAADPRLSADALDRYDILYISTNMTLYMPR